MARAHALTALARTPTNLVFYEAPHRLHETIAAMAELFNLLTDLVYTLVDPRIELH